MLVPTHHGISRTPPLPSPPPRTGREGRQGIKILPGAAGGGEGGAIISSSRWGGSYPEAIDKGGGTRHALSHVGGEGGGTTARQGGTVGRPPKPSNNNALMPTSRPEKRWGGGEREIRAVCSVNWWPLNVVIPVRGGATMVMMPEGYGRSNWEGSALYHDPIHNRRHALRMMPFNHLH